MFLLDWLKKQARKSAQSSGKNKTKRNNVARTTRSNSKGNNSKQAQTAGKKTVQKTVNTVKRGGVVISNKTAAQIKKKQQQKKKQQSQSLTGTENYKKLQKKREEAAKRGGNRTREDRKRAAEAWKGNSDEIKKRFSHVYNTITADSTKSVHDRNYTGINGKSMKAISKSNEDRRKAIPKSQLEIAKRPVVLGAYNSLNPLPIDVDDVFTKKAKEKADKSKETTAYKVSYGVGTAASFLGGAGLGKTVEKNVLKNLGKQATKVGKNTPKNDALQKLVAGRVGDFVGSTPMNAKEAIKAGTQEDGSFDSNKAVKNFAVNTALDFGIGGAFDAAGKAFSVFKSKADYGKYIKIKAKKEAGAKLTKAEQDFYDKGRRELTNQYIEKEVQKEKEKILNQTKTAPKAVEAEKPIASVAKESNVEKMSNNGVPMHNTEPNIIDDVVANEAEGAIEVKSPLKGRDEQTVGNKSTKAYMYENPEVKPYFQEEARAMLADLKDAVKGERGYNDTIGFTSTKRYVDKDIEYLLDEFNYTYDDIEKGLKAIIEDNGAENNAVSKRIEFALDERLRNGSDDILFGGKNPPNEEYNNLLREKQINEYNDANFNEWLRSVAGEKLGKSADDIEWRNTIKQAMDDAQDPVKRSPAVIKENSRGGAELFDDAVKKADYKAEAEKIIAENPQIGQNAAKQNVLYYTTEDAQAMFYKGLDDGMFGKSKKVTQEQARETVDNLFKSESVEDLANRFLGMDYTSDPHLFGAFAEKILPELSKKVETGNADALQLLMKVSDHANSIVSHGASITNAAKMWVKMTPIGRCKAITKEVERLNKQYGDRLKKPLELTDEHKEMIFKAQTDEEIGKAVAKVTQDLWDNIPSTYWEKLNTARHIGMLLNVRTNLRNVLGNTAFASVRAMSNSLEFMMTRAMKSTLQKNGADAVRATHVTGDEMKKAKDFIENEFASHYNANSQKYRDQLDLSKPENKTTLESKLGSSVEKLTYALLEKGDIVFFKPEYKRSYARWCKSKGIELDKLSEMTNLQKAQANDYAMKEAEKATFRDTTKVSNALTKLKEKTATGKGRTVAGTAGLRVANATLESVMPFVKTPINVFRQSIDYSPVGLLKSLNELATFKARGDVKSLEKAIHHMATGLTGSGITALGAFLYANDIVTVKAGEKSGDAYYDRDMGYQDYSLVIGNHSWTIDWASPMQSAFFMGAQVFKMSEEKGYTTEEITNGLMSLLMPHLDSSFMSSAKDTLELFNETVYNRDLDNGEANWGGAILKTLGGTIPQNYISTLLPFTQLMSQTAGFSDKYQRDTRSTKEDILANSWGSWGRKMINRIPGLRQELLNPKVNRKGQDVKSSDNILTRFMNSFVNPSTVKTITLDDTDRELIKIYNDIDTTTDDGKSKKKYFFYNFTGNPDYELANGERMSYDEAYKYSKASRQEQNKCVESMLKSQSYKNMTNKLKTDEIKSSYYIGRAMGDLKTYGAEYACSNLNRDGDKKIYEAYSAHGGKADDFMDFYINKEKFIARSHESDYYTKAVAIAVYGDKTLAKAYDLKDERFNDAKEYIKNGGSAKEYSNAMCNVVSTIDKSDVNVNMPNKAVAAAYHKINNRTRKAMGLDNQYSNMGIWFKENGYTFEALEKIKNNGALMYDIDTKAGTIEYVDSLGLDNWIEKACIFRYLNDSNNPYGIIPNYLEMDYDDSVKSGSGRRYGRSYGRRGGSGGSSVSMESWEEYVKQFITTPDTSTVKTSYKSPLDEAYRAKVNKIIKNMRS